MISQASSPATGSGVGLIRPASTCVCMCDTDLYGDLNLKERRDPATNVIQQMSMAMKKISEGNRIPSSTG
eukprot:1159456-Pelagomonas_calceolata.AAC.3